MLVTLILAAMASSLAQNINNHALVEVALYDKQDDGSISSYDYELSAFFTASGYVTSAEGSIYQVRSNQLVKLILQFRQCVMLHALGWQSLDGRRLGTHKDFLRWLFLHYDRFIR